MRVVVDKAQSRGYANHGWLKTHHTFSFANYYNPERVHFGMLRVLNDDSVAPGEGFDMHPHKNMEVISIPLKGYLRHGDSIKNSEVITPGDIQVMSAGTGIVHSEFNDSGNEQLEFLQIWVFPREENTKPSQKLPTVADPKLQSYSDRLEAIRQRYGAGYLAARQNDINNYQRALQLYRQDQARKEDLAAREAALKRQNSKEAICSRS